jgi:hypothetical protein
MSMTVRSRAEPARGAEVVADYRLLEQSGHGQFSQPHSVHAWITMVDRIAGAWGT